jgi:hypothetical protein
VPCSGSEPARGQGCGRLKCWAWQTRSVPH